VSQFEQFVLDGLALNDGTSFTLEAVDLSPGAELEEWIKGADSNGALLAREPLCDNRVITMNLRVEPQATMDLALAKIGLIIDKLRECQRNANGLALTYLPHDSALSAITFRCLSGQITGLPIDITSGWLVNAPLLMVKLTCLPFGEGAEVTSYVNEIVNPSFESAITPWTSGLLHTNAATSLTVSAANGSQVGTNAALVNCTTTANSGIEQAVTGGFWPGSYTFAFYARAVTGTLACQSVFTGGSDGGTQTAALTTAWTRFVHTITLTAAATTLNVALRTTATSGNDFVLDAAMLVRGATAPTYFDGATGTGYVWFGTAHASRSAGPNAVITTDPLVTLELTGVPGDVPATGRLVVSDAASQARRFVPWGLESRWYPTSSPPSLIIDSTSMVTTGFAGATATTVLGAYSGATNNVIALTLRTQPQAVCGLGNLTHVGSFRTLLRFNASSIQMALRLVYQSLEGPFRSLSYKIPVANGWNLVDLGEIRVPQAVLGAQKWTGRIEAYSTATGGEVLLVDVLLLMPSEQFGRAIATYAYSPGLLVARDDFSGRTATVALNATAMQAGAGNWATSGSATDLVAADAPGATDETISRATTADAGPRYAIAGSATPTDIEVGVDTIRTASGISASQQQILIARWTDATHYLSFGLLHHGIFNSSSWGVSYWNGGQSAYLASGAASFPLNSVIGLRMIVYASGAGHAWIVLNGVDFVQLDFSDPVLATGGVLASGKSGFADYNPSAQAITRYYDTFYTSTPAAEPVCCYSGQSIEFRSDAVYREDSTGAYAGQPPEYTGNWFSLPNAGGPARKTRVAALARRNNTQTAADDFIADSTVVQVSYTPRWLVVGYE
jgi:hypothetical protein